MEKSVMSEDNSSKQCYLSLIQEPISRMSTVSAVFKGFAASIVAGLILKDSVSLCNIVLTGVLVLSFLCIDVFYLQIERKYRYLYKQVVKNEHPVNFDMTTVSERKEIIEADATIFKCLRSFSIWPFYGSLAVVLVYMFIMV